MAIRMGRWDCKYCGHVGNLGPHKHCVNCGAGRAKDVKFYLPKNAKVVTDEDEIKRALEGPDWICDSCNTGNLNKAKFCSNCGSPASGEFKEQIVYDNDEIPRDSGKETQEDHVEAYNKEHGLLKRAFNKAKLWFYGILTAIAGFLASFSTTVNVEVVALSWERKVELEAYKWVQEKDWNIPVGGELINSEQAVHHYNKVYKGKETKTRTVQVQVGTEQYVCGQKDMGNGYFQDQYCTRPVYESRQETYTEDVYEDVPVYQTYYTYRIQRWVAEKELVANGREKPAEWPKDSRVDNTTFRYGKKTDWYEVVVERKGKPHRHRATYDNWRALQIGDKIEAEISTFYRYYKGLKQELL